MPDQRSYVLSIAGFDPSGGAGVLADVKTFEQCDVYGMGVVSALTFQNDIFFEKVEWLSIDQIIGQIEVLKKRNQFEFIKIGLIENLEVLYHLIKYLKSAPSSGLTPPRLIWDPILKASAGFEFHPELDQELLENICSELYLVTPNVPEAEQLAVSVHAEKNAEYLSRFCNVFLKGGHNAEKKGQDTLFIKNGKQILFEAKIINTFSKHGSGCVLSSAITASLAKGYGLEEACAEAKEYVTGFLMSNDTLLGYHSDLKKIGHE
jgi:hydroxymethylpyrimidine/phosphomethylpyrimidine kinase